MPEGSTGASRRRERNVRAAENSKARCQQGAQYKREDQDVYRGHRSRRDKDAREHEQRADDDAGKHVEPCPVNPGPEHVRVVAEHDQEDGHARQQHAGQRLDAHGDDSERGVGDEHDAGGEQRQGREDDVEELRLPEGAVQRVTHPERVAERVGGRQRHRLGADDRGAEQDDGEEHGSRSADRAGETARDAVGVLEVAVMRCSVEGEGGRDHQGRGADDDEDRADDRVGALVVDPARRDPLVDHVRLLEEELPGRHGRPDDGDDEQGRG